MGSLMPGWSSPSPRGDRDGRNQVLRTRSFTKEEIEEFWKRKQLEEEGSGGGGGGGGGSKKDHHHHHQKKKKQTMASSHIIGGGDEGADTTAAAIGAEFEQLPSPDANRDWWTRSSWAFLNEPPAETTKLSSSVRSYASQLGVAAASRAWGLIET